MSRNSDTKMLLEAFLDAIMVMKLKGFGQLKDKLNEIYSKKVWPTTDEIVNDIMNYMTALEAANRNDDNHGQLKANMAELEEEEYKLMALAAEMKNLQERVSSKREKIIAKGRKKASNKMEEGGPRGGRKKRQESRQLGVQTCH